jgi:hydrogenase nickel incorporation protein HypA/HybF
MHEQSIVEALLDVVMEKAKEANANKILRIYVVAGELSGVLQDAVDFYFGFLSRGTIADGASIFFSVPPTQVRCRNCSTVFSPQNLNLTCPNCRERKIEILSGRELYIDSVEVE